METIYFINNSRKSFFIRSIALLVFAINISSCKKAIEIDPPVGSLVSTAVFDNNNTAAAVVTGIYAKMMGTTNSISGPQSITSTLGLSADEFQPFPGSAALLSQAYTNGLQNTNIIPVWNEFYNYIYLANTVIEDLGKSTGVTGPVKQQLTGEAKFIRAFCHFYLVNLYGDVPLVITSDYTVNRLISRTPKAQVYQQIIADLIDAQNLLSPNFVDQTGVTTSERIRPNKGTATALLARAFLYTKDWANAETQATAMINNPLYSLSPLTGAGSIFLKNSTETVWQLQSIVPGINTYDGNAFILNSGPNTSSNPEFLNAQLLSAFEPGDKRKTTWVNNFNTYYYPFKYQVKGGPTTTPVAEYLMMLRLAEQYLIRAEARAEQGANLSGAAADLNMLRIRAGLSNTTATTQSGLLTAILHERQVELFCEWGHRWLDLKRTGNVDAVMGLATPLKGGTWNTNWQLYPIALAELQADPNLSQNVGY